MTSNIQNSFFITAIIAAFMIFALVATILVSSKAIISIVKLFAKRENDEQNVSINFQTSYKNLNFNANFRIKYFCCRPHQDCKNQNLFPHQLLPYRKLLRG